ncbi:hypothetical protein EST38_g3363 [Candolleomyces aberdarensis]|uniref:RNA polymerase II-associated protein 1 C-terminal domain-containing protein n=1 Tax=Candolleomyces aberdarensis TaxID=2316362 RepID=A0A4Q2DT89_9AGAR|nr:hypothetical protein EST38_g3363 [Candolleomyces aberdarensis]
MREQISRENEARIAGMTPEEIEDERKQILERFGAGIGSLLEKAKRNRMKRASETAYSGRSGAASPLPPRLDEEATRAALQNLQEVPISPEEPKFERARSPAPPALSRPDTRPSSRADRRLRFADLDPKDVYVYESHPPSPRKAVLALPPPSKDDQDVVSLGTFRGRMASSPVAIVEPTSQDDQQIEVSGGDSAGDNTASQPQGTADKEDYALKDQEPEEGTPEYIRRRYFPAVPANDPNLAWMSTSTEPSEGPASTDLRFDLHGKPIPPSLSAKLPTSLGLHHHAEGSHAGYTLDDIFLLSRSTVPAQRTIMMGVLSGLTQLLSKMKKGEYVPHLEELKGKEEETRKRIVAAGVEALNERGSVGLRAVELVWQCVVGWDEDLIGLGLEGIWLESANGLIRSLSLEFILPSISTMFNQNRDAYPHESLVQLLEIVQRLALENVANAEKIVGEDKLLSGIVQYFLLEPHSRGPEESRSPEPEAISLLISLAQASRSIAEALARSFVDDILRFITILPESSSFPPPVATVLLARSLKFYTVLGSYGLSTSVASTAMEHIARLNHYACSSSASTELSLAWMQLAQVWIACAIDPHATTPPHAITWSRVLAWEWHTEWLALLDRTGGTSQSERELWGCVWGALASWLEGCKVNAVRGGEKERENLLRVAKKSFEQNGPASSVVSAVLDSLMSDLGNSQSLSRSQLKGMAANADTIRNVIRLWLAFLPPHLEGPPEAPPFELPFDRLSALAANLLSHSIWNIPQAPRVEIYPPGYRYFPVYIQHFAALLAVYLSLSRRLPAVTKELWLAQACSLILRLTPGNEEAVLEIFNEVLRVLPTLGPNINPQSASILGPFIQDAVLSRTKEEEEEGGGDEEEESEIKVAKPRTKLTPLVPTPTSIASATTAVLISPFAGVKFQRQFSGLPLHPDWMLNAMNHLLHSGDSVVFKHLPKEWDASEVDVTRTSFTFALYSRNILHRFKLGRYAVSRDEAILSCMKVFMLEHGLVKDSVTSNDEVFRDKTVETLMEALLEPYRARSAPSGESSDGEEWALEKEAGRFLPTGTPFYQFYTDFVGLYDAISFSHPLFALLLLPPLSMHYAIDYRKLFWCEYPQILRTISIYPNQVLSNNLREYLYPVEKDPQVIGSLLSGIVKRGAKEFLWWVAIHHVAANIWQDLRDGSLDGSFNEERGVKLLQAVVDQGDNETVVGIVRYWQDRGGDEARVSPTCFDAAQDVLKRRKEWIEQSVGKGYAARLAGLLPAN